MTASSGFDDGFASMQEYLERGAFPPCIRRALEQDEIVVIEDPPSECSDCPLAPRYSGRAGMTHRLAFEGRVYGIVSASVPPAYAHNTDEQDLFNELSRILGFALNTIEKTEALREE